MKVIARSPKPNKTRYFQQVAQYPFCNCL